MQPSSAEFEAALLAPHRYISRIEVRLAGEILDDTYYQQKYFLLNSGKVESNRSNDTRTSSSGQFEVINTAGLDILDVLSQIELVVYSGLYLSGGPEWIQQGVFGLISQDVTRKSGGIAFDWTANDRSDQIRWLPFSAPYSIASATDYFNAFRTLIIDRAKKFTPVFNLGSSALVTPDIVWGEDEDPWTDGMKLGEAVGCECYFDEYGTACMLPIPDPTTIAPAKQFVRGQAGPLLTPVKRGSNNHDVFNGVICKAEAPWLLFPVRGEAWDTNPLSRTYRGTFGDKPKKIGNALATTDAQCNTIAAAELLKIKGVVENISFDMVSDPRLQVGDVLYYYDADFKVDARLMLDTRTLDLNSGVMSGTIRRQS